MHRWPQVTGRARCATKKQLLLAACLLGGFAGAGLVPDDVARAATAGVERPSGLPWVSGVNGPGAENNAFATWRGRALDVRTIFFGLTSWDHMISSARALQYNLNGMGGSTGRLIVAIGMVPRSHASQLEQCAQGVFDPKIRALTTAMLNHGAQSAANAGKPLIIRLGWEANNVDGDGYPWAATGYGDSWRQCFQRWVDILNPVTNAATTPRTRTKNFLIVWNMANRGSITYPIENLWPGDDYVDIIGSQFYDRCPPLPEGDKYEFEKRLDARNHANNPAGPRAWLEYAKSKGKPWAMPEWGIGGPSNICDVPGIDNPYFITKMYEFFWNNAGDIAFEAYFNGPGAVDASGGTHELFEPKPVDPAPAAAGYLDYVQRYNPKAAAEYAKLWSQGRAPVPPPPPPGPPPPPEPPPASNELYWLRYIASYPDLIKSIGPDAAKGYASWVATGKAQRRTAYFDPQGYMTRQPAIASLVKNNAIEATKHYINLGYNKGTYTYSNGPLYYLRYIASHVELIPLLGTQASAGEAHYHNTGKWEGRTVTFDALAYMQANAEAKTLCGTNQTCATKHFIDSKS